jgi:hypothetical protein
MYDSYRSEEDQVRNHDAVVQVPAVSQVPAVVQAPVSQVPAVVQAPVVLVPVVQKPAVQVPQNPVIVQPTCNRRQAGRYCRRNVQCCSRKCSSKKCQ